MVIFFFFFLITISISGEEKHDTLFLTIDEYIKEYLAQSVIIKEAVRKLEKAEKDLRRATEERVAALILRRYEIEVNAAKLALTEAERKEKINAVQRYFQRLQTYRNFITAKRKLQLEEKKLRVTSLRYESGLCTEIEFLQHNNEFMKINYEVEKAQYEYFHAKREFLLGIGKEKGDTIPLEIKLTFDEIEKYDTMICVQKAYTVDSVYYYNREMLLLAKKQWEAVHTLEDATPEERKNITDELNRTEENYQLYKKELYNKIIGLIEEHNSLNCQRELLEKQAIIVRRELEVLKTRFRQGEINQIEFEEVSLELHELEDQIKQMEETLFQKELSLKVLIGDDPLQYIYKIVSVSPK